MATRTIIALLILLVGTGGAFWITNPSFLRRGGDAVLSLLETTSTDPRFTIGENGLIIPSSNSATDISEENVVRNYGREILRMNPAGQGMDVPIKVPTEQKFTELIQEELSKPIPVTLYTEKDILLTKTSDKAAFTTYINAVGAANTKNMSTVKVSFTTAVAEFVSSNNVQNLTTHVNKLSTYVTALLAIPVPSDWRLYHLEMINLIQKRIAYANALLENNGSQLKVAAALSAISAMVDEEAQLYNTLTAEKARRLK
jgi:hypothetical protein